jgi:hypothetical protein
MTPTTVPDTTSTSTKDASDKQPYNDSLEEMWFEVTSTNDLRSTYFNIGIQALSNTIQIFQVALFIAIITEVKDDPSGEERDGAAALGEIFIFFYLCFLCPTEMCNYTKVKMRMYYHDKSDNSASDLVVSKGGSSNFCMSIGRNTLFFLKLCKHCILSSWKLFLFNFREAFCTDDDILFQKKESWMGRFLKFCGYGLEQIVITLMVVSSAVVASSKTNVMDMVVSFSGVLIVSHLDSIIIKTFPIKKVKIMACRQAQEAKLDFTKTSCEMGEFMYVGFILMISMSSA